MNGDEEDGQDEFICPVDHKTAGNIVDDELKALLSEHLPEGVRFVTYFLFMIFLFFEFIFTQALKAAILINPFFLIHNAKFQVDGRL